MQRLGLLRTFAAATVMATAHAFLSAHGGQYRGPSEVTVPPSTGGSAPSAPSLGGNGGSASGASAAPAAGPLRGAVGGSGAGPMPRQGSRGISLEADLTQWEYWWEFHKDPLLRVREGLGLRRALASADSLLGGASTPSAGLEIPTDRDIDDSVLPALMRALERSEDRDTQTACMIALAKIGRDPSSARLHDLFAARLKSRDQEVRETAALALGIQGRRTKDDIALLLALFGDEATGRRACDRAAVDDRTRSFAGYALGIAVSGLMPAQQIPVVRRLTTWLEQDAGNSPHRNITVAAIAALGQLRPSQGSAAGRTLRDHAAHALLAFYRRDLGPGAQITQAQCPMALANILVPADPLAQECKTIFAEDLRRTLSTADGAAAKTSQHIAQSCTLALSRLCRPFDASDSGDADLCRLLLQCSRRHRDQQTRYFALLALARIGGSQAKTALLEELTAGGNALERPWRALAVGAFAYFARERERLQGRTPHHDPEIAAALGRHLQGQKNPSAIGATAIALGLCQEPEGAFALRRLLPEYGLREDLGGSLAVALALLEERAVAPELREMLAKAMQKPQLMVQIASALGRLGDAAAVAQLTSLLAELDGGLARMSAVAAAIGQLGDRRCIPPLVQMLDDRSLTPLCRAFAAVALGGVCDPEPVPWNARYAATLNYRAAVETLTDGQSGILDIL